MATNAVRLAAAVLREARLAGDPQGIATARQLLTHLMKPLAFQILAKVRSISWAIFSSIIDWS